jgi:hypothetical protein
MTTYVHTISATPPIRADDQPWAEVRFEGSLDNATFTAIETQAITPADTDPAAPILRHLQTNLAPSPELWLRLVWIDADTNESPPSDAVFSPGLDDGYPSLLALLAASTVDELTGLDTAQQQALRASAIVAVESECGQSFVPEGTLEEPVAKHVDGTGHVTLWLPKRLVALTGFSVGDPVGIDDIDISDLVLDDEHLELAISARTLGQGGSWADRALAEDRRNPAFPNGRLNVTITGVWGWATDEQPAAIAEALRLDMEDQARIEANKLTPTVRAARGVGLTSVNQGGLNLAMRKSEPHLSARCRRVLLPYRWHGVASAVA